ncbi:MAG: hypothetical protein RRY10_06215, partial [Christensenellaceae bacterium]
YMWVFRMCGSKSDAVIRQSKKWEKRNQRQWNLRADGIKRNCASGEISTPVTLSRLVFKW